MDDKVFIYLRLRVGDHVLTRSKIRELAGLGSLLAQFLRKTLEQEVELPAEVAAANDQVVPTLDYVDANTEQNLISIRVDPEQREQVIEGCIPPGYQERMLDPESTAFSLTRFVDGAASDMPPERREELTRRLSRSQTNLLDRIRETIDAEGRFEVRVPLDR